MKQHQLGKVKQPQRFDFLLFAIIIAMGITSLIAIYSAFPLLPSYLNGWDLILKQIMWYGIGFVAIGVLWYLGNDSLYDFAKLGYKILMVMLFLLFFDKHIINDVIPFITPVNGATAWFQFPGIGSFQPSEFMKVILIIITAKVIQEHNATKTENTFESDLQLFGKILKWALPPLILIILQPDNGIFTIIVISITLMVLCSGIRKEWFIIGATLVGIALVAFFICFFVFPNVLRDALGSSAYILDRIYGWLYPENYIQTYGNQLYTALVAIGSAGLQGFGLQSSVIGIPEAQTDFIFAVFSSSLGLIGSSLILVLCLSLDLKLISIARTSKNIFEKYCICGILGMLVFQQLQNIGMIVGFLPITGITLPLISYGGSSLLSYMIAFGIVFNTSKNAKKLSDFVY